jgi:AcrR family transcriptional regulator
VPPTPELTRRERKKKITKENLLAVALEIISKQGIYVTTIEDVTEKADIGKGTFYQYFSSKEELLEQLLREGLEKLIALCRVSLRGTKNSEDAIKTLTKVHVDFLLEYNNYLLLFHQVRGFLQLKHPISANLRKIYSHYFLELADLLSSFFGDSPRSAEKAKKAALSLASYSTGLVTHYRLFHRLLDLVMDKDEIERRIVVALL